NRKSFFRKAKEAIKAIELEFKYSKEEILDLYFNNVYFGKNFWGIRTASIHYFGKEVEELTQPQIIYLLTLLRGPNLYANNALLTKTRYNHLNELLYRRKKISKRRFEKNKSLKLKIVNQSIRTIKQVSIPFITE